MLVLYGYFWSLSLDDNEVLYLRVSEGKNKPIIEEKGKRLLINLLINNIFSKLILSLNFKAAAFLNKGLV